MHHPTGLLTETITAALNLQEGNINSHRNLMYFCREHIARLMIGVTAGVSCTGVQAAHS